MGKSVTWHGGKDVFVPGDAIPLFPSFFAMGCNSFLLYNSFLLCNSLQCVANRGGGYGMQTKPLLPTPVKVLPNGATGEKNKGRNERNFFSMWGEGLLPSNRWEGKRGQRDR